MGISYYETYYYYFLIVIIHSLIHSFKEIPSSSAIAMHAGRELERAGKRLARLHVRGRYFITLIKVVKSPNANLQALSSPCKLAADVRGRVFFSTTDRTFGRVKV